MKAPSSAHLVYTYKGQNIEIPTQFDNYFTFFQQADVLHDVLSAFMSDEIGYTKDRDNFREIQPLNGRKILDVSTYVLS